MIAYISDTTKKLVPIAVDELSSTMGTNLVDEGSYQLTAFLNFSVFNGPKNNSNSTHTHSLFWDFGANKTFMSHDPLIRRQSPPAEFKFESSSSPFLSSSNHSRRLFQKKIEDFDHKINGRAVGAALWHSLDWRAQNKQNFWPTSRTVLFIFQTFCPVGVLFAQTTVRFAVFQVQARKRGVLGWIWGCFVYVHFPKKKCVTAG